MGPERLGRVRTVEAIAAVSTPGRRDAGSIPATRRRGLARAMPSSPRAGHPLHPMIAGHATGQKQGRYYSDRRSDRPRLRMGHSRAPGGVVKTVLSPSSPPPERPQPHPLRGAPRSRGGCAPVVLAYMSLPLGTAAPGPTFGLEPVALTMVVALQLHEDSKGIRKLCSVGVLKCTDRKCEPRPGPPDFQSG